MGIGIVIDLATLLLASLNMTGTWTMNTHERAMVAYQNPDLTACTATTVVMALNMGHAPGWQPATSWTAIHRVLSYERANDTSPDGIVGSDPTGIVAALNHFGWAGNGPYRDFAYDDSTTAIKAVIESIARTGKPAIVLVFRGAHVRVVTGYEVVGHNPMVSSDFTPVALYWTDPDVRWNVTNKRVAASAIPEVWSKDTQTGSTLPDSGGHIANRKWFHKFVAVIAGA